MKTLRARDRAGELELRLLGGVKRLAETLRRPCASRIVDLNWKCTEDDDQASLIPLILAACPNLQFLTLMFTNDSEIDFVSQLLERGSKIKDLSLSKCDKGSFSRFFAALGRSQVEALTIRHSRAPGFNQGLSSFLEKDLLVTLELWMGFARVSASVSKALASCKRLTALDLSECVLYHPFEFPGSIAKLSLFDCTIKGRVNWSLLKARELFFHATCGVDGRALGLALGELDMLDVHWCDFANEVLATADISIIRHLRLSYCLLNYAAVSRIACSLRGQMRELRLDHDSRTSYGIHAFLVPALRQPDCTLAKLQLWPSGELEREIEDALAARHAVLTVLQGRQVRRLQSPLQRLPVEMIRLVGGMLL